MIEEGVCLMQKELDSWAEINSCVVVISAAQSKVNFTSHLSNGHSALAIKGSRDLGCEGITCQAVFAPSQSYHRKHSV